MQQRRGGSRQGELFARSMQPVIRIEATHPLVLLADEIDWTTVTERVEVVREKKVKSAAGRPPHLRALIGAMLLKATRHDLAPDRGPDQALCAGALPVRANRDGLDAGPCDAARRWPRSSASGHRPGPSRSPAVGPGP